MNKSQRICAASLSAAALLVALSGPVIAETASVAELLIGVGEADAALRECMNDESAALKVRKFGLKYPNLHDEMLKYVMMGWQSYTVNKTVLGLPMPCESPGLSRLPEAIDQLLLSIDKQWTAAEN
jgi:hypothetical protein